MTASLLAFDQVESDEKVLKILSEKEKELMERIKTGDINSFLENVTEIVNEAFGHHENKTKKLSTILDKAIKNSGDKASYKANYFDKIRSSNKLLTKNIGRAIRRHLESIETDMKEALADARKVFNSSKAPSQEQATRALDEILEGASNTDEEVDLVKKIMYCTSEEDLKSLNLDTRNIGKKLDDMLELFKTSANLAKNRIESLSNDSYSYTEIERKTIFDKTVANISDILSRTNNDIRKYHPMWSNFTFAIMFLPGIAIGLYVAFSCGLKNKDQDCPWRECPSWFKGTLLVLLLLMTFFFPIGLPLAQLFELIILCATPCGSDDTSQILKTLSFITDIVTAFETFFEAVPQIILQLYIICVTDEIQVTQIVSITISMVMLVKTTITYDLMFTNRWG